MSTGYLPVLGAALRHGPWVAGLCAFAVTPGALIVIALVLERRWLVPAEQFAAVAYGDPLLAVAAHPVDGGAMTANVWISKGSGAGAAAFASVNIFGGFLVVRRMLAMYKKKAPAAPKKDAAA